MLGGADGVDGHAALGREFLAEQPIDRNAVPVGIADVRETVGERGLFALGHDVQGVGAAELEGGEFESLGDVELLEQ